MSSPITCIYSLTRDLATKTLSDASPAMILYNILRISHFGWWGWRKVQLIRNPDNYLYLLGGQVVNRVFRDTPMAFFLKVITICTRLDEVYKQVILLRDDLINLGNAFTGRYPFIQKHQWQTTSSSSLSVRLQQQLRLFLISSQLRLKRIALCAKAVAIRLFILNNYCLQAYDSLFQKENPEILIDTKVWMDRISNHKMTILNSLQSRQETMQVVLKIFDSEFTAEQVIKAVSKQLESIEFWGNALNKMSKEAGQTLSLLLKHNAFNLAHLIGKTRYLPNELLPDSYAAAGLKV